MSLLAAALFGSVAIQAVGAHAAGPPRPQAPDQTLPDAPGRDEILRICTMCHGADYLWPSERTVPVWRDTFDLMKSYGATASEQEWNTIQGYIMSTLAYLGVNEAPAEDIAVVFGVDEKAAQAVVAHRDKQGAFKTIDDVKKVPGLDAARVDGVKARLIF